MNKASNQGRTNMDPKPMKVTAVSKTTMKESPAVVQNRITTGKPITMSSNAIKSPAKLGGMQDIKRTTGSGKNTGNVISALRVTPNKIKR